MNAASVIPADPIVIPRQRESAASIPCHSSYHPPFVILSAIALSFRADARNLNCEPSCLPGRSTAGAGADASMPGILGSHLRGNDKGIVGN